MKSIKTLQCLNLKKMWMCSSCAKLVQINFHVDWSGIKKFEILDWIDEIQTNDQDLSYNIHQWKMKQFPRFYEADRQIQIFRVFVMIIHDKYKWSAKVILFKTGNPLGAELRGYEVFRCILKKLDLMTSQIFCQFSLWEVMV